MSWEIQFEFKIQIDMDHSNRNHKKGPHAHAALDKWKDQKRCACILYSIYIHMHVLSFLLIKLLVAG